LLNVLLHGLLVDFPKEDDKANLLHWPSPPGSADGELLAYSLTDSPRFFVPEWGPTPIPSNTTIDPGLVATNGYDFRNEPSLVSADNGYDTYIFLLGSFSSGTGNSNNNLYVAPSLESWHASRVEFLVLTGPTPLLPGT
jgi:hypothetical protein